MKGTEAKRFRLRLDKARTTAGRSSIQAGPTLLPKVPIAKNSPDAIRMNRRAAVEALMGAEYGGGGNSAGMSVMT